MVSYIEFCERYCLDVDSAEARQQYEEYKRQLEIFAGLISGDR